MVSRASLTASIADLVSMSPIEVGCFAFSFFFFVYIFSFLLLDFELTMDNFGVKSHLLLSIK
jgi:hypothetical protein